jgi:hypothetical protein
VCDVEAIGVSSIFNLHALLLASHCEDLSHVPVSQRRGFKSRGKMKVPSRVASHAREKYVEIENIPT